MGRHRVHWERNRHMTLPDRSINRRTFVTAVSVAAAAAVVGRASGQDAPARKAGNPVLDGWDADPEAVIFGTDYWISPTYSASYDEQTFFDAFSSKDLVNWTKHPK